MQVESAGEGRARRVYRAARRWSGAAALVALSCWAVQGCKSEPEPTPSEPEPEPAPVTRPLPQAPPFDACEVDADCGFGEIDHEIAGGEDCPCIYGCPYLPLTRATIERRQAQYESACDPRENGNGESCGVDDCARPPAPACVAGRCSAAP